jgi:hypothetical protein
MTKAISSGVSSKLYTPINTISTSLSISSKGYATRRCPVLPMYGRIGRVPAHK